MNVDAKIELLSQILETIIRGSRGNRSLSIIERQRRDGDAVKYESTIRWSGTSMQEKVVTSATEDDVKDRTVVAMTEILTAEADAIREKAKLDTAQADALTEELKKLNE